jgi:uncharacterized DUF497 family protein
VFLLRRQLRYSLILRPRMFDDSEHSETERREIIIGYSNKQNLILVSFVQTTEFD